MNQVTREQVEAGQAVYGKVTLAVYDKLVLGATCRWLWRCPAQTMLAQYHELATANHLDVGVGSGYFLDHCRFPCESPRIALMDLNAESLAFTARRIARYQPVTFQRNVLEDMSVDGERFDSVAMNMLLHCVPGNFRYKGRIFDHASKVMNPGAVLFGATLLARDVPRNPGARALMAAYNRKGIFANRQDTETGLRQALTERFDAVEIEVVGCMALFSARQAD